MDLLESMDTAVGRKDSVVISSVDVGLDDYSVFSLIRTLLDQYFNVSVF